MAESRGIEEAIRLRDRIKKIAAILPPNHHIHDVIRDINQSIETIQKLPEDDFKTLSLIIHGDLNDPIVRIAIAHMIAELKVAVNDLKEEIDILKSEAAPVWTPGCED